MKSRNVGAPGWIVRSVAQLPYDPVHARQLRLTTMEQLWQEYLDARRRSP